MMRLLILVVCVFSYVRAQAGLQTCAANVACQEPANGAVDCAGDCGCRDNIVDECGRPHPTTGLHVSSIQECMTQCQVFALEDRCKFIIFHYDNIDENCLIMNNVFDDYVGHCNQRGQPLWGLNPGQGLARWEGCLNDETCNNDSPLPAHTCNSCTDCGADGCRGFMLSDCNIFSDPLETSPQTSFKNCEIFARTTGQTTGVDGKTEHEGQSTYVFYNEEQAECAVYGDVYNEAEGLYHGFDRVCEVAFVELGTDPVNCAVKPPPTPSPTPPPPQCITDPDCNTGEICNVDQICVPGCHEHKDCHDRPCDCTIDCVNPTVECRYCETSTSIDGHCMPGCAETVDCPLGAICNGMHLCVPVGAMTIESLTMTTAKCDGCAGTNVETGASIWIRGFLENSAGCITGNLDHADRVDYAAGFERTFTSDPKELGVCNSANMDGFILSAFTVTWKGAGSWTPSTFSVSFTGTPVKANCAYSGAALTTGKSATIACTNK